MFSMMTEIKNILKEGGAPMTTENNTPIVEEPVIVEPVVDTEPVIEEPVVTSEPTADPETEPVLTEPEVQENICPDCGKPTNECVCIQPAQYNLEEIPEYVELRQKHENLEAQYNTLITDYSALVEFKKGIEKKEKEAMIDSFYMLSEEDKKDVVNNIDEYSLEDIEAKLSILCVRNKVSFADHEDNKDNEPTVYSLNNDSQISSDIPEWVKALQEVAKTF
jgi:hypothetical protein